MQALKIYGRGVKTDASFWEARPTAKAAPAHRESPAMRYGNRLKSIINIVFIKC